MRNTGGEAIRTQGNVLDQLGFEPAAALELKLKAQLHRAIVKMIRQQKLKRRELEQVWNVPQPRVSEFMRGKLSTLSVAKMLYYARLLGLYAEIKLRKAA
jgi:predicted XRE-type DNA-binding protein